MTATREDLKKQMLALLDTLSDDALAEVATFLDYQRSKVAHGETAETPYRPIALAGLWSNHQISDEDIADVRREMWGRLADSAP
jgi:hypothetical protein